MTTLQQEYATLRTGARPLTLAERYAVGQALITQRWATALELLGDIWQSPRLAEFVMCDYLWWVKDRAPAPPPELAAFTGLRAA